MLLASPHQYKYGIRDLHFNKRLYFKVVISALLEGVVIVWFTFYSLCQTSANIDGKYGSRADGGDFIYAVVIFIPSVKIMVDAYEIGWGLTISVVGSVAFYMICHVIVSESSTFMFDGESYKNLSKDFTFPSLYFGFFGFVFAFILFEYGLNWTRRANKIRRLRLIEDEIMKQKEKEKQKAGLVKKK